MARRTNKQLKASLKGKESQKKGLRFEKEVEQILSRKDIFNIRIPQAGQVVKDRKTGKLIIIKRAGLLDFIIFSKGFVYLIECKSTQKNLLYKSYFIKTGVDKASSTHKQFEKMKSIYKKTKFKNIGFLIKFKDTIRFINIQKMLSLFNKKNYIDFKSGISFDNFLKKL